MKAVLMTAAGETDVLQVRDIPAPTISDPKQVLVAIHAAGVNPLDTKVRKLDMFYPDRLPAVLGCDAAGVVQAVGSAVTRFKPGDEVYFFNDGLGAGAGCYAESAVVHEDFVARKPRQVSMVEAAALPLVLITAWEALVDRAQIRSNESILVHAGAGGVGHVAVQLAAHRGARVAATVSSDEKARIVRSLGAERVIKYRDQDFVTETLDWTGGAGADVVMDTLGGTVFCESFAAVRLYGRLITLSSTVCDVAQLNKARLRNLTIGLVQMTTPLYLGDQSARRRQTGILEEGSRLVDAGKLKVLVSETVPLEAAATAHRNVEAGHTTGKVVLKVR